MKKGTKKAFTLVELIVTITILAILGTIGFMSFQSYTVYSRDVTRQSELSLINRAIKIKQAEGGYAPMPENYVEITASGELVGYQGEFTKKIGNKYGISGKLEDPLDGSNYIYSVDKNLDVFTLGVFMEGDEVALTSPIGETYAKDGRKILLKGDKFGIILKDGEVVNKFTGLVNNKLDLVNTNDKYEIFFEVGDSLIGTGSTLKGVVGGGYGLVGYWDFDYKNGTGFIDRSRNNLEGSFSGGISIINGKFGKAVYFDGTIGTRFDVGSIIGLGNTEKSPFTITSWIKVDNIDTSCGSNSCRQWILLLGNPGIGSVHYLAGGKDGKPTQFGIWSGFQRAPKLVSGEWKYITLTYDGIELKLYENGIYQDYSSKEDRRTPMNIKGAKLNIGGFGYDSYFKGAIDDLRIYNRALTQKQIKDIYNLTK